MSQSDYNIENADGATVRADINSQLEAIGSANSGSTAPPVTFPYMRWHDTASAQLKERNGANTAWIVVADILAGELVPHAGGAQVPQISGGADANFTAMPQVGGDPVVESGSNTDGEWTRWADGTQSTRGAVSATNSGTTAGSNYLTDIASHTFPAVFISAPSGVSWQPFSVGALWPVSAGVPTATSVDVRAARSVPITISTDISVEAEGHWK